MTEFEAVAKVDDLKEGEMRAFDVQGTKIAVANVAGTFHAFGHALLLQVSGWAGISSRATLMEPGRSNQSGEKTTPNVSGRWSGIMASAGLA